MRLVLICLLAFTHLACEKPIREARGAAVPHGEPEQRTPAVAAFQ